MTQDIEYNHIAQLDAQGMQDLLRRLVIAECHSCGVPLSDIKPTLPDRSFIKDGGADAILETDKDISKSDFFFNNRIIFQSKAESINNIRSEVKKDQVKEFIQNGGAYVLFCNKLHSEGLNAKKLENEFKEQISQELGLNIEHINFKLYDHSQISNWIEKYYSIKIWLLMRYGLSSGYFRTFDCWAEDPHMRKELQTNENLANHILNIKDAIKREKIIRIEGQAGIGKTRQIFEAVKSDYELQIEVLYSDAIATGLERSILDEINSLIISNQRGIIILDDCPLKQFRIVREMILQRTNNLKLISIDYEGSTQKSTEYFKIEIAPLDNDLIEKILGKQRPSWCIDLKPLISLCGQNPRMAEIICEIPEMLDFSNLPNTEYLSQMYCPREENQDKVNLRNLLEVCSLFNTIYYTEENDNELIKIGDLARIPNGDVLRYFNRLKDNFRVIQNRYEWYTVTPQILAFQMITSWLYNTTSQTHDLLEKLPDRMKESCYSQLENLNTITGAQVIAERLLRSYNQKKNLTSIFDMKCFYHLARIAPSAALAQLNQMFSDYTYNDYLNITDTRRILLNILECLVFHKSLFYNAAEIILNLADAENETWSNNATGLFKSLFKLYLSGTECPALDRLNILIENINGEDTNKKRICLEAIGQALDMRTFIRSSGAEKQGNITLKDWEPSTPRDILEYIMSLLDILKNEIMNKTSFSQKAKDILGENMRSIIHIGGANIILDFMESVISYDRNGWNKALIALNHIKAFDMKNCTPDSTKKIHNLEHLLKLDDIADEIRFNIISENSWHLYHKGNTKDDTENLVKSYSLKLKEQTSVLNELLPELNSAHNYHVFLLGKSIASLLSSDEASHIIETSSEYILQKVQKIIGCSFINGIFAFLDFNNQDEIIDKYLDEWKTNAKSAVLAVLVTRTLKNTQKNYKRLTYMIDSYDFEDYVYFYMPIIGSEIYPKEFEDVFKLINSLLNKKKTASSEAVIHILNNIITNTDEVPLKFEKFILDVIHNFDILSNLNNNLYEYECKNLWNAVFYKQSNIQKEAILNILLQRLLNERDNSIKETNLKFYIRDLIILTLQKNEITTLNVLSNIIAQNDINWGILNIHLFSFASKDESMIDGYGWDILKSYIDKDIKFGMFLAKNVKLLDNNKLGDNYKNILEYCYHNKTILEELRSNIFSFTWCGDVRDYYGKVKSLITPYQQNPTSQIREWANQIISILNEHIDRETKQKELLKFGVNPYL